MIPQAAKSKDAKLLASALLFLLPALALTTNFGMTLIQLVIIFTVLGHARPDLIPFYRDNFRILRWIIVGFAGLFAVALFRMVFFHGALPSLDGPTRLLLALSCIGFVALLKPRMRWFWLGLCAGAIGALLRGQAPGEPRLMNTCYSLVQPEYGISIAGVYRPANGLLADVEGAGGTSPLNASPAFRAAEASYAEDWFQTITAEAFG